MVWVSGIAPETLRIPIRIPAVVVISHANRGVIIVVHVPDLTSYSTCSDIYPSQIAGTKWVAFLTFILISDRSLFSALNPCLSFPPSLWILLPWPSDLPAIREEIARDKKD